MRSASQRRVVCQHNGSLTIARATVGLGVRPCDSTSPPLPRGVEANHAGNSPPGPSSGTDTDISKGGAVTARHQRRRLATGAISAANNTARVRQGGGAAGGLVAVRLACGCVPKLTRCARAAWPLPHAPPPLPPTTALSLDDGAELDGSDGRASGGAGGRGYAHAMWT
jgi:hypothetical protein